MAFFELVKEVAVNHLLDTSGLWALLALIPLIIVYLIRPRPKKQTIPALMFLMKDSAKSDKRSFIRHFIKDPLFLFQILVLIAFALAIAKPYITAEEDLFVEKTAIVIDASASSQVMFDGKTRFERSIEIAKEKLGSKNAVILISSVPELVVNDVDSSKAREELSQIRPRDTPTNIFDSMIFAGNYVKEKDKMVIISDFIETASQKDFAAAKSIIESKGVIVEMINTREAEQTKPRNIGIIGLDVGEETTSVQVKNFNDQNETVRLEIEGANLTQKELRIDSKAVEVLNFPTPAGLAKFSIIPQQGSDDFALDNDIYISSPPNDTISLLLIANSVSKYLKTALDVIETIDVERGNPPQVPQIGHQIIMINSVNRELILPGTIKAIRKTVDDGASLVIMGQADVLAIDFEGLMPVERADNSGPVLIEQETTIFPVQDNSITEDMNFGRAEKYLKLKPMPGATVIATTEDNSSVIVMRNYGKGIVLYFGFLEEFTTFKEDIYYPVFWKRFFDFAIKKQDLSDLNFNTGRLVNLLEEKKITAPFGKVVAETILLTHQGIYRTDEKNFVANLLNEEESNINGDDAGNKIGVFGDELTAQEKFPFELTRYFIIGLLIAVFIELLWIKFRGDL